MVSLLSVMSAAKSKFGKEIKKYYGVMTNISMNKKWLYYRDKQ